MALEVVSDNSPTSDFSAKTVKMMIESLKRKLEFKVWGLAVENPENMKKMHFLVGQ